MGLLRAPSGDIVTVPDEQVESSIARGYTPVSAGEAGQTTSALPPVDNGALGALGAAATSTLSGLTLGASDVALRALLTKGQADQVAADRAAHPVISGAGQFAGNLLPAFAAPESLLAKTPAGLTSSLGRTITEHAAGEGAGLGTRILAGSTGAAAEGAIYGGGQYLSDTALEDKPLSAEGFVGAMGHGALFAAPIGGALTAGEAALLKVRSLFPSAAITPEAARTAQQEATSGIQQAVSDGDQMAEAVKQKIALTDAQTGMAQAGEQVTRRVFGAADPASIVDQATGGATRAQMSDALDKFEASKVQLQDWIQSEADPELEQALTNLRSPKLQITGPAAKRAFYEETQWPPEMPSVRHTPDDAFEASMLGLRSPDVQAAGAAPAGEQNLESLLSSLPHGGVQREAVPVGEFGAPGKGGIKSPEELEQALREAGTEQPSASVPSASSLDSTRAGKRGGLAEGTPAQAYAESPPPAPARPKYAVESVEDRSSPRHITQVEIEPASAASTTPVERFTSERTGRPSENRFAVKRADGSEQMLSNSDLRDLINSEMPKGFNPGYFSPHKFSLVDGIPENGSNIAENSVYVTTPSALAERGIMGNEIHPEHATSMAEARSSNIALEPIKIDINHDGKLYLEDGNHRLQHAATSDAPVAVQFRRTGEHWTPQENAIDISDRIRKALPARQVAAVAVAPATDTLTGLLRGTKSRLDAGASLNDIGAPSRAEYAVAKQARTSEAAEHFRSQARAAATPPAAAAEPASELEQLLRGTKQGLDSGAGMRDIGEAGRAMRPAEMPEGTPAGAAPDRTAVGKRNTETNPGGPEDLRQFADHVGRTAEPPIESGVPKTKVDPEMRGRVAEQESIGKTIVDHGMRGRVQQATDDEAIAKLLGKREGKGTDIGPGLARAAKAIGDYEEASAGLVDALGPEAPPSAAQRAKTYRESTAAQADATGASAARATQDINDKLGPAVQGAADKTAVDDSVAKAAPRWAADAASAAAEAFPTTAARRAAGATKAASALEVLKAFGVHIPVVSAIPVIGPILGAYLKAKAIMSVIGRKGGGIGRTVEGIVAAKSATTRNRIAAATKSLLDVSVKGVKKVSAAGAGPLVTLAGKLFPGGANPSPKDPQALYQARIDEIQRALAPGAIDHAIGDRIQTSNPALHDAVVAQVQRGIQFLDSKAPKQSVMPGMLPGDGAWHPSKAALEEFGRYVHAVNDPASVLEDLAKGTVTLEGAETLRTVYPGLYAEAQRTLLEAAPKMATTLPYPKRVAISIMYQVPVDGTMSPSHMQFLQPPPGAPPAAPPMPHPGSPAIAGQLLTGQQTMTSLDRRAGA